MVYHLAKKVLFRMEPEQAHTWTIRGLHAVPHIPGGLAVMESMYGIKPETALTQELFGHRFSSPVGLAAGLDKNGSTVPAFSSIGFGFMEVGTVTPKAQPGNDKPRLFRLVQDEALINRMGFNNEGADAMARHLERSMKYRSIPVAVNIGKNKTTPNEEAALDYQIGVKKLYRHADFFVINISSPNTPDLRKLQHGESLKQLLTIVKQEMKEQGKREGQHEKAILVKIAPDLNDEELEQIVHTTISCGMNGIICTNTTLSREGLNDPLRDEIGGMSGRPLRERSTEIVRRVYAQTGGKLPIIGCGGIWNAQDAYEKIRAGASLVELYTALIYQGPGLLRQIQQGLLQKLRSDGFSHISEAIGADHQ